MKKREEEITLSSLTKHLNCFLFVDQWDTVLVIISIPTITFTNNIIKPFFHNNHELFCLLTLKFTTIMRAIICNQLCLNSSKKYVNVKKFIHFETVNNMQKVVEYIVSIKCIIVSINNNIIISFILGAVSSCCRNSRRNRRSSSVFSSINNNSCCWQLVD